MPWYKRFYGGSPWAETSVQAACETLYAASGAPAEILLIEQVHAPLVSTLWLRLPNQAIFSGFPGFELWDETQFPKQAVLLVGDKAEFEKLFPSDGDKEESDSEQS
jgi:hypothetical protein